MSEYCDWVTNPPKNHWDLCRRSILEYIRLAETHLAKLKNAIGDFPHNKQPNGTETLRLLEEGMHAARHAASIEPNLRDHYDSLPTPRD